MANSAAELERGRDAYASRAWRDAYVALAAADESSPLGAEDLELLSMSASLIGRVDESHAAMERAHHAYLESAEPLRAAGLAVMLGMNLALRGEVGPAGGWFGRAQRLIEREEGDCVERGYLLLPVVFQQQAAGDYDSAYAAATEATSIAERFGDTDLLATALHLAGYGAIKQGRIEDGLRLLDEAMLSVTAGEVSPFFTGIVYCGVIAFCEEAFEPRRAREWTNALTRWCESQPQLVSFTGRCLAHRAGIKQLHGEWRDALEEARLARERCEEAMNRAAAGQAYYQQGELHRLQGDITAAEAAYREASGYGREPQPGLALLRLAQGDVDAAAAAIRRVVAATSDPLGRAALLPAHAEIMLACGDVGEARATADELAGIAAGSGRPMLEAIASQVRGAVDLAEGDAQDALSVLRRALQIWQELGAPYEVARVQVLVALACRALGDDDTAALELEAARATFDRLGAAPSADEVDALLQPAVVRDTHGLTPRELEVLRLVAAGKTNREIASALVVSEHTVARHLQNIFTKLRVSSRTAATAFAYEHELV